MVIKLKLLLQCLLEPKIDWDDLVPSKIQHLWEWWRKELSELQSLLMPRCYFPKDITRVIQLHGFSDASETAYARMIYMWTVDSNGDAHLSLAMAKPRWPPSRG